MQTLHTGCSKADPQTHTYTQTDRTDYNTLQSLTHSVKIYLECLVCITYVLRDLTFDPM